MSDTKIMDKVKKLLRLAESDNVNEAATAASRAQALIDQHHIDVAMLSLESDDAGTVDDEEVEHCVQYPCFTVGSRMPAWRWYLLWAVAEHNACKPWSRMEYDREKNEHRRTAYVIGRPSDAQVVQTLYAFIRAQIDYHTDAAWDALDDKHRHSTRTWKRSFREGAVSEVKRRLLQERRERRAKLEASADDETALARVTTALALVDGRITRVESWMDYNRLKYGKARSRSVSGGAYSAGRAAGRTMNLSGSGKAIKG